MFNTINFVNFCNYYKKNLCLSEEEFTDFIEKLNTPLPLTFRTLNLGFELPFTKISYLENVYQCLEYKTSIYRNLIISLSNIGSIYRQEIVSMLPVLYLDLKDTHWVLDMCAAPGSKSTQIMEIVKNGLVVCNDSNRRRVDILKTRTNKIRNKGLIITNNDARVYPNIYLERESTRLSDADSTSKIKRTGNEKIAIKYDRVLCDVPCSGDATIRKNPDIANKWQINDGISLGKTQYTILRRGLSLLKDKGILVYSTCSFNPAENEAVVQRAVLDGDCEIIEGKTIEGLIVRKGLKTWDPQVKRNAKNEWLWPVYSQSDHDGDNKTSCMDKGVFTDIGLDKCIRVLPHDQNTGGFFVAVLRKKNKKKEKSCGNNEGSNTSNDDDISTGREGKQTLNDSDEGNNMYNEDIASAAANEIENIENKTNMKKIGMDLEENTKECRQKECTEINIKDKTKVRSILRNSEELFSSEKLENKFYCVNENTRRNIEAQFGLKFTDRLVTQSTTNSVVSVVSNDLYNIGIADNQALKVISIGYKAFAKNGFKGIIGESFRLKPGVLEDFMKDKVCTDETNDRNLDISSIDAIVYLNKHDTILVLENEFVEYSLLSITKQKIGSFIVSLYKLNCKISAWSGNDKISVLLEKNHKKAYLEILKYKETHEIET